VSGARRSATIASVAFALVLASGAASACPGPRPTDPGGFQGIAYTDPTTSYATTKGRVRVWYATVGSDAPDSPSDAHTVGDLVEGAIDGYVAMGYRLPPKDDADPSCPAGGGDGRLDVYLIDLQGAADGLTAFESCTSGAAPKCSSFILIDNDFAGGPYASYEEGAKTVAPHEYFHVVQNGYDAGVDRWWAEGTAQWACQKLHPDIHDLERFLPSYFMDTTRSIDSPPGGVTAEFLYGTAIWPVFLGEHVDPKVMLETFEDLDTHGGAVVDATDRVLMKHKSSFASEFETFGTWNAATGARAGKGGYKLAATYPEVTPMSFTTTVGSSTHQINSGFGVYYFDAQASAELGVSIDTDPKRNAGAAVPLSGGVAQLAKSATLPANIDGETILVVAGQSSLKTDAPFTLTALAEIETTSSSSSSGASGGGGAGGGGSETSSTDGGCSCVARGASSSPWSFSGAVLLALAAAVRSRRSRSSRAGN
jgi:MYXO-CTERM domain-containing protein